MVVVVVERFKQESMYGLFAGTKKMAVVERWPLPEVQPYFFADRSIPKPPMYPLPAKCWHLAFFEKVWSNSQVCWQFRWSNAPPPPPPPPSLGLQKASNPKQRLLKNFPCVKSFIQMYIILLSKTKIYKVWERCLT